MKPGCSHSGRSFIHLSAVAFVLVIIVSVLRVEGLQRRAPTSRPTPATPARASGKVLVITGQPGSVVFINNVRHGVTDDKGELSLPRVMAGAYPVRVKTVGFADGKASLVVAAGANRTVRITQQPIEDQATLHYQK